ncbi:MAG TPA: hypothetical protein VMU92_03480 [Acidobacteriaceae bacterium]|nr:hypothetical protein [Acidobacteriaceae bacterium]
MSDANASATSARYKLIFGKGILGFGLLGGVLIFLLLTGLAIWLLPFSVTAQVAVLLHTAFGLLLLLPLASWLFRHWLASRNTPWRVQKIGAYGGFWALAVNAGSGLLLSWEAFFSLNINHVWDRIHLWSGIVAVPLVVLHLLPEIKKRIKGTQEAATGEEAIAISAGRRRMWIIAASTAALLSLVVVGATSVYHAPNLSRAKLPKGYKLPYGPNPFAPSLATTASGHPVPAAVLAQSQSCGASGCHTAIYREAQASAHTWASQDILFQGVQAAMIKEEGTPAARYCAGCHDPVSLLSAYKDASTGVEAPGFKEGDSCVVCHSMERVDVQGNGNYVFAPPTPYLFEYGSGRLRTAITHFLIRAYPWHHDKDYDLTLADNPVSCASCHKQFINKQINHVGWVQLQNQYDEWRTGKWNTDPNHANRLHCQDCHMYTVTASNSSLADPYDHAIGLGNKHHNHWFAASNQIMPALLHTYDAAAQVKRVNAWLKGQVVIPAIARIWPKGPVIPIKIIGPASAKPGEKVQLRAVVTNNKAGHNFATGPLDLIRAWIEVEVRDASGQVIFHSGQLTPQNHIEPGTIVIRSIGVNPEGHPILRHHLWHYVGTIFKRSIPPGYSDMYAYHFTLPKHVQGPLQVTSILRYRKANQYFMNFAFPGQFRKAPITDLSYSSTTIQIPGPAASQSHPAKKGASGLHTGARIGAGARRGGK